MYDKEIKDKFADMWRKSRENAGKSQEYVAKALGVSKKTVQNWESGYSCPSQELGFRWFNVLGLQPMPYYTELMYGNFDEIDDKNVENALITMIKGLSPSEKRKLLYVLNGNHGSSTAGIIEMITAHLHVPLKDRLNVAQNVLNNYEIAESHGDLVNVENVLPNIEMLQQSYVKAKSAVKQNKNSYTNLGA